jgi:hypothetical protein
VVHTDIGATSVAVATATFVGSSTLHVAMAATMRGEEGLLLSLTIPPVVQVTHLHKFILHFPLKDLNIFLSQSGIERVPEGFNTTVLSMMMTSRIPTSLALISYMVHRCHTTRPRRHWTTPR